MGTNFAPSCENLTMGYHEITYYSIIRQSYALVSKYFEKFLVQIFRQLLNITED